jgi:hypothetical protein
MKEKSQIDPKIEQLLSSYSASRAELLKYLTDVDTIRTKVDSIFPTNLDNFRNKFFLEEKIKSMSSFFTMLLNIRQEYNKSIKDEIEIRRKINDGDNDEEDIDVMTRRIAEELDRQQRDAANQDPPKEEPVKLELKSA